MKRLPLTLTLALLATPMFGCSDEPEQIFSDRVHQQDRRAMEKGRQMRERWRRDLERGSQTEPIPMPFRAYEDASRKPQQRQPGER